MSSRTFDACNYGYVSLSVHICAPKAAPLNRTIIRNATFVCAEPSLTRSPRWNLPL